MVESANKEVIKIADGQPFKVIVVGDSGVGKTRITQGFVHGTDHINQQEDTLATIGVMQYGKKILLNKQSDNFLKLKKQKETENGS